MPLSLPAFPIAIMFVLTSLCSRIQTVSASTWQVVALDVVNAVTTELVLKLVDKFTGSPSSPPSCTTVPTDLMSIQYLRDAYNVQPACISGYDNFRCDYYLEWSQVQNVCDSLGGSTYTASAAVSCTDISTLNVSNVYTSVGTLQDVALCLIGKACDDLAARTAFQSFADGFENMYTSTSSFKFATVVPSNVKLVSSPVGNDKNVASVVAGVVVPVIGILVCACCIGYRRKWHEKCPWSTQ